MLKNLAKIFFLHHNLTMRKIIYSLLSIFLCTHLLSGDKISLEEKIGQMLIVGFRGSELKEAPTLIKQMKSGLVGGVILYDIDILSNNSPRNVISPDQVLKLCVDLQKANKIPLLIAIDQEGGLVNRLPSNLGFPTTLSASTCGEDPTLITTHTNSETIAKALLEAGINLNFAPVLDLRLQSDSPLTIRQRCFSNDPKQVSDHAKVYLDSHRDQNVITCLKHFPGLGSAKKDSHLGFVDITETWSEKELLPFSNLIAGGNVDCIMLSHAFNKNLDPIYPASLSAKVIEGLLRKQFGFTGVVITDDMQMGAISKNYTFEQTILLAIEAGSDILLFGNQQEYDPDIAEKAFKEILKLVSTGKISAERIDQSYQRIQALKSRIKK